jgi:hypothetical protein
VWSDDNANGQFEYWEWVVSDINVELYLDDGDNVWEPGGDDTLLKTTMTNLDGLYLFSELGAGSYWVYANTDGTWYQGYATTTANPYPVNLTPGEIFLDADIGLIYSGS